MSKYHTAKDKRVETKEERELLVKNLYKYPDVFYRRLDSLADYLQTEKNVVKIEQTLNALLFLQQTIFWDILCELIEEVEGELKDVSPEDMITTLYDNNGKYFHKSYLFILSKMKRNIKKKVQDINIASLSKKDCKELLEKFK